MTETDKATVATLQSTIQDLMAQAIKDPTQRALRVDMADKLQAVVKLIESV